MRGLIHLYTGEGKGKTTAALGLLLRASGHGMRTALVQFLKGSDTGEIHALKNLPNVTVLRHSRDYGFFKFASDTDKAEIIRENNVLLTEARRMAQEGLCDLLVLDELCGAYTSGTLDRALADQLIFEKPEGLELVLTGRDAPAQFVEAADYVTEFRMRKHPYQKGIAARKGIEF